VLDVREPWEFQTAHVTAEGFELLNLPMGQIPSQLAALDPERPTACLCHHGMRSMQVAMFLAQHDFGQVANIEGGIDAWSLSATPAYRATDRLPATRPVRLFLSPAPS
jgi:rhodanese-related sulfurtransferase